MYHIIGYQTNPITGETQFQILCDTAADLPTSPVSDNGYGGEIGQGSKAVIIADGSSYLADSNRQWIYQPNPNAWVNVYTKLEIDEMITEIYETIAYYHTTLVSDTGEITFYAFAGYIGTWTIYGNGQQTGTPTPDNPVMPDFCGTLDGTDWKIPITCAGQTTPVYLGQVSTVRRIIRHIFDGTETGIYKNDNSAPTNYMYYLNLAVSPWKKAPANSSVFCSHLPVIRNAYASIGITGTINGRIIYFNFGADIMNAQTSGNTLNGLKEYLAAQYAAGHPVTIWYVLAEPETAIVNEPLTKIGDYADELHSADAGVAIPTVKGENTLTVDTILKPSRIEIQG